MPTADDSITFKVSSEQKERARRLANLQGYHSGVDVSLSDLCRKALEEKLEQLDAELETPA